MNFFWRTFAFICRQLCSIVEHYYTLISYLNLTMGWRTSSGNAWTNGGCLFYPSYLSVPFGWFGIHLKNEYYRNQPLDNCIVPHSPIPVPIASQIFSQARDRASKTEIGANSKESCIVAPLYKQSVIYLYLCPSQNTDSPSEDHRSCFVRSPITQNSFFHKNYKTIWAKSNEKPQPHSPPFQSYPLTYLRYRSS